MKVMHAICRVRNGSPDRLHAAGELGLFKSGIWRLRPDEAVDLKHGWMCLHETFNSPAYFVARIEALSSSDGEGKYWLTVRRVPHAISITWKGPAPGPAKFINVVDTRQDFNAL